MAPSRSANVRRAQSGIAARYGLKAVPPPPRLDEAVFFSLVAYLGTLAQDGDALVHQRPIDGHQSDGKGDAVPPAKRARTDAAAVDYVPVARRTLTFSRRQSSHDGAEQPRPVSRLQANALFGLRYRKHEGLTLSTRGRSGPAAIRKVVFSPDEVGGISDADAIILEIAEKFGSSPPRPGRFWTAAFVSVDDSTDDDGNVALTIELELRWMSSVYVAGELHVEAERALRHSVLTTFFPDVARGSGGRGEEHGDNDKWSPQDFYEAAHVTRKDDSDAAVPDDLHVPGLTASLFPFQRRAVKWLLQREGVRWAPQEAAARSSAADSDEPSVVVPYRAPDDPETTSHFTATTDADGAACYVSELFGVVTRDPSIFAAYENAIRGGILSEEMGLGKTVEMIALILLHPRPEDRSPRPPGALRPTGATLIVAPPALKNQWIAEFQRHAPHLSVMVYAGMARSCASEADEADVVAQLAAHDVVVTTYSDLKSELHFAVAPPERSMRSSRGSGSGNGDGADRKRYRPRSPLVQLSWWRVCLDEAQEIESGVSNTATVVRVIPRINAWGVTGTPVKDGVQDLRGLLLFLLYEPYASIPKVWQQLTRRHKRVFRSLFGRIALRHSKRAVGDELSIPPQKRYVITMPFTAVEEQHYQSLFARLAEACGLDALGVPLAGDWNPDDAAVLEAMRTALSRLRQTALHPEIGGHNRRALGHRAGPMRTVAEVLDAMIEQSESALLVDRRALLAHRLRRGQLLENSPRAKEALAIWQDVLAESAALVDEARAKLRTEEAERAREAGEEDPAAAKLNNKKKKKDGKGEDGSSDNDDNTDTEEDEADDDDDQDKAAGGRLGEAQRELRYALELLHKAEFFCANGHFQIKSNEEWTEPESDEFRRLERLEVEGYERAKRVRREILHENRSKAARLMADLAGRADAQGFVEIPDCAFAPPEGIEGRRVSDELDRLAEVLSAQAAQMDEWREAVIQLLLKDLVDDDDEQQEEKEEKEVEENAGGEAGGSGGAMEITGDEYEDSTKVQDELQAYITILKAGISDRNALLTGIAPSGLALYEERLALRMAKDDEGPAPQLMLRLFAERQAVLPPPPQDAGVRSLRAAVVDLREIAARLRGQAAASGSGGSGSSSTTNSGNIAGQRAQMELACVARQLARAQAEQTRQLKVSAALEKETNKVRNALNTRIAYYRQLQVVSDMVALYEGPKDGEAVAALVREEGALAHALATAESKHRYLVHLKEADDSREESRLCVICQSTFSVGVLTVCGHQFCKECIALWFRAHRNCPVCKRKLSAANLHDITLKPQELKVASDHGGHADHPEGQQQQEQEQEQQLARAAGSKTGIYAAFSADKLAEIKNIDLPGPSFTTKVDTLVRHLLWLRASDPGAKSVVFSQYPAFLTILGEAFRQHRIGFSRYDDRGGSGIERFKDDPGTECFLLHARAHSSGLNLVNASHVLLCEPLLNTALELQAIARVHRIGQRHATTVWLYVVDGTVEASIYDLSVRRRLAHMGGDQNQGQSQSRSQLKGKMRSGEATPDVLDRSLELANSLELQQAQLSKLMGKGKMAGEEVAKGDLWTCLFGNAAKTAAGTTTSESDERLRSDPAVRRYLAAEAADARHRDAAAGAASRVEEEEL